MKRMCEAKELEWVNSYLDQELDETEIQAFAERLAQNPELSTEVADFLQLKHWVKSLPQEKPPHNYILTRKMAETARKPGILERLFPVFRVAALVCCLGLVLTFLLPGMQTSGPAEISSYSQKSVSEELTAEPEALLSVNPENGAAAPFIVDISDELLADSASGTQSTISQGAPLAAPLVSDATTAVDKKSSHGVRGGSPKNEMLMTAERILPDDYTESMANSADTTRDSQTRLDDVERQATDQSEPETRVGLESSGQLWTGFRLGFIVLLGISLVWMMIVWLERKRISS